MLARILRPLSEGGLGGGTWPVTDMSGASRSSVRSNVFTHVTTVGAIQNTWSRSLSARSEGKSPRKIEGGPSLAVGEFGSLVRKLEDDPEFRFDRSN
jgi:hypothetical protein